MRRATMSANHFTNPARDNPSASVTSVASSTIVVQAASLPRHVVPGDDAAAPASATITTNAASAGSMKLPPKIHSRIAHNTSTARIGLVPGDAAHLRQLARRPRSTASGLFFTSGG